MKLSKFPVTSPAGNEYRVTITPGQSILFREKYIVTIYVKRTGWQSVVFPFKPVGEYSHAIGEGIPNYITVASDVVSFHEFEIEKDAVKAVEACELAERKRQSAAEFAAWDGVITETDEGATNGTR